MAHVVGKWCQETGDDFYALVKQRIRKPTRRHKLKIVSDGNGQNTNALLKHFDEQCVEYAQVVKIRENQQVIAVEKRNVIGEMSEEKIAMHHIDSYCGTLRERIPIYVRETKAFSKRRQNVENRLDIYQIYRNMIETRKGKTVAMREGITEKRWTWGTLLRRKFYPT